MKIILSSDMASDVDDVAALGILLHRLETPGVELLAAVCDSRSDRGAAYMRAVLNAWGHTTVPVGAYKGSAGEGSATMFQTAADEFGQQGVARANFPSAGSVLRAALSALGTGEKATIVIVGQMGAVYELLLSESGDDGIAEDGEALFQAKVEKVVWLSGRLASTEASYNERENSTAAAYYMNNDGFGVPTYKISSELGQPMVVGPPLAWSGLNNPIKRVFDLYTGPLTNGKRSAWDPTAVWYALYPDDPMWTLAYEAISVFYDVGATTVTKDPLTPGSMYYVDWAEEVDLPTVETTLNDYLAALSEPVDLSDPIITSTSLQTGGVGEPVSWEITSNSPATFSIVGGADAGMFSLDGALVTFAGGPAGAYEVVIRATETGSGNTTDQTVAVVIQAAGPSAVFEDSFDRSDENLEASPNWTLASGTAGIMAIRSGSLAATASGSALLLCADQGGVDHYAAVTVKNTSVIVGPRIVCRAVNQNNYVYMEWDRHIAARIGKRVNGSNTTLGEVSGVAVNDRLKIEVVGDNVTLYKNDTIVVPPVSLGGDLATSTRQGVSQDSIRVHNPWLDDFEAASLSTVSHELTASSLIASAPLFTAPVLAIADTTDELEASDLIAGAAVVGAPSLIIGRLITPPSRTLVVGA